MTSLSSNPSITLDSALIAMGSKVAVTGTGFSPNSPLTLQFDNVDIVLDPLDGSVRVKQDGTFSTNFYLSPRVSGQYTVKAIADSTSATAKITVDDPMKRNGLIPLVLYYLALMGLSGYLLVNHWQLLNLATIMANHPEIRLGLVAGMFGLMGSTILGISSLTIHAANRNLTKGWASWYITHPPVGAILAVLVYVVLRAGLMPGNANFSFFGVAAIGALVGFATKNTMEKLRDILNTVFGTQDAKTSQKSQ